MEYIILDLTLEQTSDIYNKWIHLHFPQDEIKPFKNIVKMWQSGSYRAFGMYERKEKQLEFIGYAFLASAPDCNMLLLDYLAVVEAYRRQGMGGIFLHELRKNLQEPDGILGIIIETEDVDFANSEEELRERRQRDLFYERNGVQRTAIKSEIYGVHYAIWQLPVTTSVADAACKANLEGIYRVMIPGEKNKKFVKIQG